MDTIMVDSTSKQNDSWILTEKPRPNKTKRLFSTNARCLGIFGLLVHVCMYTCMFMYWNFLSLTPVKLWIERFKN